MTINDIKPYPKNAKKHPQKHVDQIAASIKKFGMNQPIVVNRWEQYTGKKAEKIV